MAANQAQILLQQASGLLQQRQFIQAAQVLRQFLKLSPRNSQALNMLGVALLYQGDLVSSRKAFAKSIKINPIDPGAHTNLGNLYARQDKFESAIKSYQRALNLQSGLQDALYNLALSFRKVDDQQQAKTQLYKLLTIMPAHANAHSTLGLIYQDEEDYPKALEHFDKCLAIDSRSVIALHNKAVVLKLQNDNPAALLLLHKVVQIDPKIAEAHQNIGSCYAALGEAGLAQKAFSKAIELEPFNTSHHHWLNQLLWVEGSSDFLKSYYNSIKQAPESHYLRRELVYKLTLANDFDEAAEQSRYLLQYDPSNAMNYKLYGVVLRKQQKFEEAVKTHLQALHLDTDNILCQEELATSYLSNGDHTAALPIITNLISQNKLHQGYIALKATALRIAGSDQYYELYNYEKLLLKTIIETPKGYSSLAEFNQELQEHLAALHLDQRQPLDQSLMHGSQTIGDLFTSPARVIQLLKNSFDEQMQPFLNQLPVDDTHPTLSRNTRNYVYTGAWSVLLKKQGYHLNHFHSDGWYSGPYYIHLPTTVENEVEKQGWVQFGEPGFDSVIPMPADLIVKPEPGLMVRFPSYMWHGTIPFDTDETRMVVALDIDPV